MPKSTRLNVERVRGTLNKAKLDGTCATAYTMCGYDVNCVKNYFQNVQYEPFCRNNFNILVHFGGTGLYG